MNLLYRTICALMWTCQGPFTALYLEKMLPANDQRTSKGGRLLLWTVHQAIMALIHAYSPPGFMQVVNMVYIFGTAALLLWYCYSGRYITRLAAYAILMLMYNLADASVLMFNCITSGAGPTALYIDIDPRFSILAAASQLIAISLEGIACAAWCRWLKRRQPMRHTTFLLLFALTGLCMIFLCMPPAYGVHTAFNDVYMAGEVCVFLSIIAGIFVLLNQSEKEDLSQELAKIRRLSELEQVHYTAIEARREELAQIRHDYNNIITTVRRLLQDGAFQDAEQMLSELSVRIAATRETPFCAIPIINAVLGEKQQQCEKLGIPMHTDLLLPNTLPIKDLDLCSAFSNLLDNAIRASAREENPEITLSCRLVQGYLVMKCVNPSSKGVGDKPDNTGYGLKILNSIAASYQGDFFTEYKNGIFTAQLSLYVTERLPEEALG